MQIVIDIPEEIYDYIHNEHIAMRVRDSHQVASAIANGTPLDEPFINKPCISEGVCHEDTVKALDKIRAEIESEMNDLYRQKSIDQRTLTIIHACQRHIAIIDEYTKGESEIWNTPNADNRIVAPKGTFKKIYEDEDDDNDI